MADQDPDIRKIRETKLKNDSGTVEQNTREIIDEPRQREREKVERNHNQDVAVRVVWLLAGILLVILAIRFILALLAANPSNGFANFIYTITYPPVSPFVSLFNYDITPGKFRVEIFTLVAMAVYALIAWGIAKAITVTRR